MNYNKLKQLIKEEIKIFLNEARLNPEVAEYTTKKDKIIVTLKGAHASAFTKFITSFNDLKAKIEDAAKKKVALNDLMNKYSAEKDELDSKIRDKILSIIDQQEAAMTLTIKCAGSALTLAKETDSNKDTVIPANKIEQVDYKKAYNLLYELLSGNDGLKKVFDDIIKASTTILTEAEKIKPGKARALRADTVDESISSTFKALYKKLTDFISSIKEKLTINNKKYKQFDKLVKAL